jgi:uncharacterized protein (DUF2267 family)
MSTGLDTFDTTVQKTNELMNKIEKDMGWQDRRVQTYAALRVVLITLRKRLMENDLSNFVAQLPVLIKGIMMDGWDPANEPIKMDKEEFLNELQKKFNYSVEGGMERVVKVVLDNTFEMFARQAKDDLKESLPESIDELLE